MSLFECYFLFCFSNLEIYLVSDHFITIAIILLNQGPTNCCFNPVGGGSACATISNPAASSVLPSLQCILQQNTLQRVWFFYIPPPCFFIYLLFEKILVLLIVWQEEILKLIKYVEQTSGNESSFKIISIVADQACTL